MKLFSPVLLLGLLRFHFLSGRKTTVPTKEVGELSILRRGRTEYENIELCKECFWFGKNSFNKTIHDAIEGKKKAMIAEINSLDDTFVFGFNIEPNFTVGLDWSGKTVASNNYKCKEGVMCEIRVLWDGFFIFKGIFSLTDHSDQLIGSKKFPEWHHEKFTNSFIMVTHRFGGEVDRQILFNTAYTIADGYIGYNWWALGRERAQMDYRDTRSYIRDKYVNNENMEIITGIFGYFKKP